MIEYHNAFKEDYVPLDREAGILANGLDLFLTFESYYVEH